MKPTLELVRLRYQPLSLINPIDLFPQGYTCQSVRMTQTFFSFTTIGSLDGNASVLSRREQLYLLSIARRVLLGSPYFRVSATLIPPIAARYLQGVNQYPIPSLQRTKTIDPWKIRHYASLTESPLTLER